MPNKKIRLGILGGGGDSLIGVLHRIASSMHDNYEIVGGVSVSYTHLTLPTILLV